MPVKHPKSTKQVADKKRCEGEKRSVSHNNLYRAYEIAHTPTNFVLDFKLFPNFYIIFGISQLMQQAKKLYRKDFTFVMTRHSIVATFCQYFIISSNGIYRRAYHTTLNNGLGYQASSGTRRVFPTVRIYFQFFTATLITDREASIENAIAKICPTWKDFRVGIIFSMT